MSRGRDLSLSVHCLDCSDNVLSCGRKPLSRRETVKYTGCFRLEREKERETRRRDQVNKNERNKNNKRNK